MSTTIPFPTTCPARDVPAALGISVTLFSLAKAWQGKPLADIIYVAHIACYYLLKGKWIIPFDKNQIYQWLKKIVEIKKMLSTHIALNEGLILDFLLA